MNIITKHIIILPVEVCDIINNYYKHVKYPTKTAKIMKKFIEFCYEGTIHASLNEIQITDYDYAMKALKIDYPFLSMYTILWENEIDYLTFIVRYVGKKYHLIHLKQRLMKVNDFNQFF